MKKSLITLTMMVTLLAGCAGMGGNEAYSEAHKAASARGIAEANASAKANETIALAIASAAKGCETDACRMGAMMSYASIKAQIDSVAKSVAPVIQAPVNQSLELLKAVLPTVTQLGGIWSNLKLGTIQSNNSVALEGIRYGTLSNIATTGITAASKDPLVVTPEVVFAPVP